MKLIHLVILASATGLVGFVAAGPLTWAGCQTACNAGYVVCCAAAGAVAGECNNAATLIASHGARHA